jgi:hypothetical protein
MKSSEANLIVKKMSLTRNKSVNDILREFAKYNIKGQVIHFWPEENEACQTILFEQSILCSE